MAILELLAAKWASPGKYLGKSGVTEFDGLAFSKMIIVFALPLSVGSLIAIPLPCLSIINESKKAVFCRFPVQIQSVFLNQKRK